MDALTRRDLLKGSAAFGLVAAASPAWEMTPGPGDASRPNPLTPPAEGSIPVGFLISDGAVIIDFCGPWEVFQDARVAGRQDPLFTTYTVAETTKPIRASGGMQITPDHDYASAPLPKVLVIPAQSDPTEATLAWVRKVTETTDVTMSVCNGAYLLAKSGLLDGKPATVHHGSYVDLATQFPRIHVEHGARFVEAGKLATSGGLSSGIDLAFRVVERYFGRALAVQGAFDMEYQGQGWMNPDSNAVYAQKYISTAAHPVCIVCGMDVNPKTDPSSVYKGHTYYFCSLPHKQIFDAHPDDFV